MTIEREEVLERIRAANRGLQISSDSRLQHTREMKDLLQSFQNTNGNVKPGFARVGGLVRNGAILLVAFTLGMAGAASSNGVPGDLFYRAKRVAERPAQLFDRDIVASNRIGELEELIQRGAEPEVVLKARTDAALALQDVGADHELKRTLTLLAWPGGPAGEGIAVAMPLGGISIAGEHWDNETGYTTSLADGHLATVSSTGGRINIEATGDWKVSTLGTGWLVTSADVDQSYVLQRRGDDLMVMSERPIALSTKAPEEDKGERALDAAHPVSPGTSDSSYQEFTDSFAGTHATDGPHPDAGASTTAPPPATGATVSPEPSQPVTSVPSINPTTSATSAPTTTRASTTAQTTARAASIVYLRNPGSGNTSSSRTLTMSTGSAPGGSLPNYDTDRDDGPGLMVAKDGAGLSTSDRTKGQEWVWTVPSSIALDGAATLDMWIAAKDFKTDERIGLMASIDVCNPGCRRIGTGEWTGAAVGGFQSVRLNLGSFDVDAVAGSTLRLKVVVPDELATTDVWLAYDSASHPSRLTIE